MSHFTDNPRPAKRTRLNNAIFIREGLILPPSRTLDSDPDDDGFEELIMNIGSKDLIGELIRLKKHLGAQTGYQWRLENPLIITYQSYNPV
jgi:hypothetical protein